MRRRDFASGASLLALAGCVKTPSVSQTGTTGAAAAGPRKHPPHVLVYADGQNFTTLNPHLYTATSLVNLSHLTMAYLVRYDENAKPVPELATEVPTQGNGGISTDGKTITWHLRADAHWSDGVPFDADDVVFSTQAVLNPKNNEVGRDGWDLIEKIEQPDKYTVIFHLRKPYASYLPTFFGTAGANPCILPKHILGNLPDINTTPYNSKPIGIGPFRYVEWKRGDSVVLEANPYYFRGLPKLKQIVYKQIPDRNTLLTQLETGEIDFWTNVGPGFFDRVKALRGHTVYAPVGFYYGHIDFNVSHPILSDVNVRRALRFALDRKSLVDKAFHGAGVIQETMISPRCPAYRSFPEVPYDPDKANALLDEAGWKQRGTDGIRVQSGRRFSLEYAIYTGASDVDTMVELIRGMWKAVGVEIVVKHYDTGLYFALAQNGGITYGGKFDVASFYWGGDPIGDVSSQYECDEIPPNGQNFLRWCDKRFDADMAKFKTLYSFEERQPYVDDAVGRIIDQVPTIVTFIEYEIFAYTNALQNFKPNVLTPFDDFMNVDI